MLRSDTTPLFDKINIFYFRCALHFISSIINTRCFETVQKFKSTAAENESRRKKLLKMREMMCDDNTPNRTPPPPPKELTPGVQIARDLAGRGQSDLAGQDRSADDHERQYRLERFLSDEDKPQIDDALPIVDNNVTAEASSITKESSFVNQESEDSSNADVNTAAANPSTQSTVILSDDLLTTQSCDANSAVQLNPVDVQSRVEPVCVLREQDVDTDVKVEREVLLGTESEAVKTDAVCTLENSTSLSTPEVPNISSSAVVMRQKPNQDSSLASHNNKRSSSSSSSKRISRPNVSPPPPPTASATSGERDALTPLIATPVLTLSQSGDDDLSAQPDIGEPVEVIKPDMPPPPIVPPRRKKRVMSHASAINVSSDLNGACLLACLLLLYICQFM